MSCLGILRSLLSSPAAAAMVLGNSAAKLGADAGKESESSTEIDETYWPQVLDLFADEEAADYAPTGPVDACRLGERARALAGPTEDWNLRELVEIIRRLLGMTTARLSFPASYRRQNTSRLSCPSS